MMLDIIITKQDLDAYDRAEKHFYLTTKEIALHSGLTIEEVKFITQNYSKLKKAFRGGK